MRNLKLVWMLVLTCLVSVSAWAQNVRIIYPQEGQDVRGEVTVRFEGIPQGGYALVNLDGVFKKATAQEFVVLDTIADRATFSRGDGPYKLDITVLSPGGGRVGTASVTFNVANNKIAEGAESVRLAHWTANDIYDKNVLRYRVFAESNASIEEGGAGGAGAASAGGGLGGAEASSVSYIPAPLDWQVAALMRSMMRDIGTYDSSANIATIVQESFERQRLSESGQGTGGAASVENKKSSRRRGKTGPSAPVKAPWKDIWTKAPETGNRFVKMIRQDGTEINATRKAPTIALADLLPTFPKAPVRPGSTWETTMTILGDLSSREGVNVQAPITFTSYETIITPAGESRRAAKLESRFRLPDNLAKKIAANLGNKVGTGAGVGGAGVGASGGGTGLTASGVGGGAEDALLPEDIEVARTDVARVMWFDMDRRRILRSEDRINSYFEIPPASEGTGEAAMAAGPGAGVEGATTSVPSKISYSMSVTTWQDDRIPDPTDSYTNGAGTAHTRDSVVDVTLAKAKNQK